jgi:chemotaxis protein histidine kinase CheA
MMDPLFPELPEDLSGLTDEALADLLKEHEVAAELIEAEDEEFTKGLTAQEVLEQQAAGVEAIEKIVAEQAARVEAQEEYLAKKNELAERRKTVMASEDEPDPEPEPEPEPSDEPDEQEKVDEVEPLAAEAETSEDEQEKVDEEPVAEPAPLAEKRPLRRPPAPSAERQAPAVGTVLVAAAGTPSIRGGQTFDRKSLAEALKRLAVSVGSPTKHEGGIEQRFLVASANYRFPAERILTPGEPDANAEKIRKIIPDGIPGVFGNPELSVRMNGQNGVLVASGGLCAPLEPIYSLVNFASAARPVRESLPSFQAERGGVNVPTSTYIGDIVVSDSNEAGSAVGIITEEEDALGGTFATKSCMDLTCPDYTETAVTIIYHCREYGNLNARAWPEKIAHENDLTMAAHSRAAESYLLRRIKAQSLAVTQAAVGNQMNLFASLVHAITKATASIRFNLRMTPGFRFRVLMPQWIGDALAADNALWQFNGQQAREALTGKLAQYGVTISYYMDDLGDGSTSQGFSAEEAGALDEFPDDVQYAIFPEGAFIHVDSGALELGLVRDSTLNSTNDFQFFGETFENVARLAPLQATRWVTQDICPNGVFPALGTALTC